MSTQVPGAPPAAPPQQPPAPPSLPPTMFQPNPAGGDPIGQARVTRNVPPKRVVVLNGTVTYGGVSYNQGDSFIIGDGPSADGLAMLGHVSIVNHDAGDEWNGKEGDEQRKAAHAHLDALAKADPNTESDKRLHDHGFEKYKHAAPGEPMSEQTPFRQQDAQEQQFHGISADEHNARRGTTTPTQGDE